MKQNYTVEDCIVLRLYSLTIYPKIYLKSLEHFCATCLGGSVFFRSLWIRCCTLTDLIFKYFENIKNVWGGAFRPFWVRLWWTVAMTMTGYASARSNTDRRGTRTVDRHHDHGPGKVGP